jgi:hypothetical protein
VLRPIPSGGPVLALIPEAAAIAVAQFNAQSAA